MEPYPGHAISNRRGEHAVPDPQRGSLETGEALTVEDVAHGCQGNLETQLEQFTHNLAITAAGVLSSETENETFNLLADCWSTTLVFVGIAPFTMN